mgnify:CR=1 FL=1
MKLFAVPNGLINPYNRLTKLIEVETMVSKKERARDDLRAYLEEAQVDAAGLSDRELALVAFRSVMDSIRARNTAEDDDDDEVIVEEAVAEIAQMREERRQYSDSPVNF